MDAERITSWAAQTGPETERFVAELLAQRPHPEHGYRSVMGIISLGKKYGTARIEKATARARALNSYSYASVKSILDKNLDGAPLPARQPTRHHRPHANIRGPRNYR